MRKLVFETDGEVGGFGSRNFQRLIKGHVLKNSAVRREGDDVRCGRLVVSSLVRNSSTFIGSTVSCIS